MKIKQIIGRIESNVVKVFCHLLYKWKRHRKPRKVLCACVCVCVGACVRLCVCPSV